MKERGGGACASQAREMDAEIGSACFWLNRTPSSSVCFLLRSEVLRQTNTS